MTRGLTAELPSRLAQHLEHVTIAHPGPPESHAPVFQRPLQAEVAHERADYRPAQCIAIATIRGQDEQQLVAVHEIAEMVDHHDAVAVTVEGDADVCSCPLHHEGQKFRLGRAAPRR